MSGIVLLAIKALGAAQPAALPVSLPEVNPDVGAAIFRSQPFQSASMAMAMLPQRSVALPEVDFALAGEAAWRSWADRINANHTKPETLRPLAPQNLSSRAIAASQAQSVPESQTKDQQRYSASNLQPARTQPARIHGTVDASQIDASQINASQINASQVASTPADIAQPPLRPTSGGQLFLQRWAALRAGMIYTRLPQNSFAESWRNQTYKANYQQWLGLLAMEADAMARGQGQNRLAILLGDSLSQWIPSEGLASDQLWLNQSISGDTTSGILMRVYLFAHTRPDVIYLMAGINDLRRGHSDITVLRNTRQILRQLRAQHPQARIVVKSILPTRYDALPARRIRQLNAQLAAIAQQEGAVYLDLASLFSDQAGILRRDLTTDGIHLSPKGYELWQWMLFQDAPNVAGQTISISAP